MWNEDLWHKLMTTVSALETNYEKISTYISVPRQSGPKDQLDALTMERARLLEQRDQLTKQVCADLG